MTFLANSGDPKAEGPHVSDAEVERQVPGFRNLIKGNGFSEEQKDHFDKAKHALDNLPEEDPSDDKIVRAMQIVEDVNNRPMNIGPRMLEDSFRQDEAEIAEDGGQARRAAKPLKSLSARQKTVVLLHLQGIKSSEIAFQTGYSLSWVSTILSDPLVVPIIEEYHELSKKEIVGLSSEAVDVQRQALRSKDEKIRLKASETVLKASGLLDDAKADDSSVKGLFDEALARITNRSSTTTIRAVKERTVLELSED